MQTTINYGLKLPEGSDAVNIEDLNYNAGIIDQKLKVVETVASNNAAVTQLQKELTSHEADYMKIIGTTSLPTTAKDVTGAIKELFTSGVNTKNSVVTALNAKKVNVTTNNSWADIVNAINSIKLGDYCIGDIITDHCIEVQKGIIWTANIIYSICSTYIVKVIFDSLGNFFVLCKVTNSQSINGIVVFKLNNNHETLWQWNSGSANIIPVDMAVDDSGNCYVTSNINTIWKLNGQIGVEICKISSYFPRQLTIDGSGNIISATYQGLIKFDSNLNYKGCTISQGGTSLDNSIVKDRLGNFYVASGYAPSGLRKYNGQFNSGGELVWTKGISYVSSIAIDSENNIYITCDYCSGKTLIKFDSNGNEIWSKDNFKNARSVAVDSKNNIYVACTDKNTIKKFANNGNLIWEYDNGNIGTVVELDKYDNLYITNNLTGYSISKLYSTQGYKIIS